MKDKFIRFIATPVFAKLYGIASIFLLLATTSYWALLGARIHASNADQVVNVFLFESGSTFNNAILPDQHTFLLKWPLFLLINAFGSSQRAFTVATIAIALLTVGALAYILYRIERRPLVFGTLCLALASALLLVPTLPYPGGMLPVSMAMITTRNLEYIVFIISLILLVRSGKWRSWQFAAGSLLMALVIASDKLFFSISVGGALLAILFYALFRKWELVKVMAKWLVASVIGAVLAAGVLWLIGASHLTNIADGTLAGPYGLVTNGHELALGFAHVVLSLFTNIGANPAGDTRLLATVPGQIIASLASLRGVGFVVNIAIALIGFAAVAHVFFMSIKRKKDATEEASKPPQSAALNLSIALIWTTVAACGAFVVSHHYYPVDARYVGIALFALFIALATFTKGRRLPRPKFIATLGALILVSVVINLGTATNVYNQEKAALIDTDSRNTVVAEAIKHHPVDVLIGDYWRVLPIKVTSKRPLTVNPLASCTQNRDMLSSRAWQKDPRHHRFAYLLSLEPGISDYPACSLEQVVKEYGSPNTSVVVAGTIDEPKELLLFYDKGSNKSAPAATAPSTIIPVDIEQLPHTACAESTIMNIVAHEDDDLLFMSPDLPHSIKAGNCIRTVYVTSGDSGTDTFYWLGREKGSQGAYNTMIGLAQDTVWIQRIVRLPAGQFATVANPRGNAKISLIFMHLPDGNVQGQGFDSSHHESLERLEQGNVPILHTTDQQSAYTSSQVTDALASLMQAYRPAEIRTQADLVDHRYPDHSDHLAVGRYTKLAHRAYAESPNHTAAQMAFYVGYPVHSMPENVVGEDLIIKQRAFFDYARFDTNVCNSAAQCAHGWSYDSYLKRQHKKSE